MELAGQFGPSGAVVGIEGFILPAGVVEDGKELHNSEVCIGAFCQQPSIFKHSGPVRKTVPAFQGLGVLGNDGLDYRFWDHGSHLQKLRN